MTGWIRMSHDTDDNEYSDREVDAAPANANAVYRRTSTPVSVSGLRDHEERVYPLYTKKIFIIQLLMQKLSGAHLAYRLKSVGRVTLVDLIQLHMPK